MKNLTAAAVLSALVLACSNPATPATPAAPQGNDVRSGFAPADLLTERLPRDEIWYMAMTDRFADGDVSNNPPAAWMDRSNLQTWQGGDWKGLTQHIDYLKTLGVTSLWISPVTEQVAQGAPAWAHPENGATGWFPGRTGLKIHAKGYTHIHYWNSTEPDTVWPGTPLKKMGDSDWYEYQFVTDRTGVIPATGTGKGIAFILTRDLNKDGDCDDAGEKTLTQYRRDFDGWYWHDAADAEHWAGAWAEVTTGESLHPQPGADSFLIYPYHGYWSTNLERLNPYFGTAADLSQLSSSLHANQIKLIVDVVPNHTAPGGVGEEGFGYPDSQTGLSGTAGLLFPFAWDNTDINRPETDPVGPFNTVGARPAAGYYTDANPLVWDQSAGSVDKKWQEVAELAGLRDLNQFNPQVWAYQTAAWNSLVSTYALDGLRVDAQDYFADSKMLDLARTTDAASGKPHFTIMGESLLWADDAGPSLALRHNNLSDANPRWASFNYTRTRWLSDAFLDPSTNLAGFRDRHYLENSRYHNIFNMVVSLDNHDVHRAVSYWQTRNAEPTATTLQRVHLAMAYLFSQQSVPMLYYGTEQALQGLPVTFTTDAKTGETRVSPPDPANRAVLPGFDTTGAEFRFYQTLTRLRTESPVLRRGSPETDALTPAAGARQWAFYRTLDLNGSGRIEAGTGLADSEAIVTVLNKDDKAATVTLTGLPCDGRLVDELTGSSLGIVSGGTVSVTLPARTGAVASLRALTADDYTAAPDFTPQPGTYKQLISVTLSCATPGATLRYTTDGRDPSSGSQPYTGPVALTAGTWIVKAVATAPGKLPSPVAQAVYVLDPVVHDWADGEVWLRGTANAWGNTHFTKSTTESHVWNLNGVNFATGDANPRFLIVRSQNTWSPKYNWLNLDSTSPALAGTSRQANDDLGVGSRIYNLRFNELTQKIWIEEAGGQGAVHVLGDDKVWLRGTPNSWGNTHFVKSATEDYIWVLDNVDFSGQTSPRFLIVRDQNTWSPKYAWTRLDPASPAKPDLTQLTNDDIGVKNATYRLKFNDKTETIWIEPVLSRAPAPVIKPDAGQISPAEVVSLSSSLAGSTIYYTTDGSLPTAKSTPYSAPFGLPKGTWTVKAITTKAGLPDSAVSEKTFTVTDVKTLKIHFKEFRSASPMVFHGWAGLTADYTMTYQLDNGSHTWVLNITNPPADFWFTFKAVWGGSEFWEGGVDRHYTNQASEVWIKPYDKTVYTSPVW